MNYSHFRKVSLVLVLCISSCAVNTVNPGSGVVIDYITKQPIADVAVSMDCGVYVGSGFTGHGSSVTDRVIDYKTDFTGKYSFNNHDVNGCDYIAMNPTKLGYQNLKQEQYRPHDVPEVLYLTKNEDADNIHINIKCSHARDMTGRHGYFSNFVAFMEAQNVTMTENNIKKITSCFCNRLNTIYSSLNNEDIQWLEKQGVVRYSNKKSFGNSPINHDRDVIKFCDKKI